MKELCLYLDEERANVQLQAIPISCTNCGASIRSNSTAAATNALRDDGDGSSSSTNNDEPMPVQMPISVRQFDRTIPVRKRNVITLPHI